MTPRDFCFWFMGSLELIELEEGLNEKQTQILKNHLNMVFEHIVNEDGTLKDEPFDEPKEAPGSVLDLSTLARKLISNDKKCH
jgi:hypothetical protein